MKKIKCELVHGDYIQVKPNNGDDVDIDIFNSDEYLSVTLSPEKIRKLRKQLKKALREIEGEGEKTEEKWKVGDKVFLIHGDRDINCSERPPSTAEIDLCKPVTLRSVDEEGRWTIRYKLLDGAEVTGYASEHSFGKRAD